MGSQYLKQRPKGTQELVYRQSSRRPGPVIFTSCIPWLDGEVAMYTFSVASDHERLGVWRQTGLDDLPWRILDTSIHIRAETAVLCT